MSTSVSYPSIGGTTYPIPTSGEVNWPDLTNLIYALGNTAQSTGAQKIASRVATSSPVTVNSAADCVIITNMSSPSAVAVGLPAGVLGQLIYISDGKGDALTNNITITANGAQTINGASSYVIQQNRGAVAIVFTGPTNWSIVGEVFGGGISRATLAPGLPGYVVINDGSGVLSQEQFLSAARGGMGVNASGFAGFVKAAAGVFSAAALTNADLPTGIDPAKLGAGTVSSTEFGFLDGTTAPIQGALDSKAIGVASAVNDELVLFSGTGGKSLKRASFTGYIKGTAGVGSAVTTIPIGDGGTGQTTANAALNALLPTQTSNATKFLQTDGTNTSWTASSGGLSPVGKIANYTAANNEMVECDTTAGSFTVTLPSGTTTAVVGILDSGPFFSTNNLIVAPATGQSIDIGAANDTITFDGNRQSCIFYRASGSTVWEIQTASQTAYAAGFTPGYTGTVAIGTGYIGQVITGSSLTPGLTTATRATVSTIPLTTGTWLVSGSARLAGTSTGTASYAELSSLGSGGTVYAVGAAPLAPNASSDLIFPLNSVIEVTGASQTVFFNVIGSFTVGSVTGSITNPRATRIA